MTKMTSVGPDSNCQTPTWLGFLNQVLPKPELVDFTKRVCGYALTGATHAHALFFFYGTGANGKTTLLNTIINCAGDYHRSAAIETFTNSNIERHPTEIAGLLGARVVTASETEEGRRWAESRIKALTGGDKISARFMRQDFFEFTPQFKLLIAGNHKPGLHSVDEAIRRRFHLLPFDVTIPPEKRDPTLPEKIKRELPGILAWMIEGCLEFQRVGLAPPASVTDATSDYLNDEDSIGAWIDECCAKDPAAFASNANLYASWSAWAKNAGEYGGNQRRFLERLEGRGFQRDRNRDARGIVGLVVRVIPAF
jgi:putative DNA primase/helicase